MSRDVPTLLVLKTTAYGFGCSSSETSILGFDGKSHIFQHLMAKFMVNHDFHIFSLKNAEVKEIALHSAQACVALRDTPRLHQLLSLLKRCGWKLGDIFQGKKSKEEHRKMMVS